MVLKIEIDANYEKIKAIIDMESSQNINEVQKLHRSNINTQ